MKVLGLLLLSLYIVGTSAKRDPCLRFCTINHRPVCATNGNCVYEFKNKCTMDNNNCVNRKHDLPEFKLIHILLCYKAENACHPDDVFAE